MNKTKGYTLIELLIIIVFLCIVGIILLPIILKKIDSERHNSATEAAHNLVASLTYYHELSLSVNEGLFKTTIFTCDGKTCHTTIDTKEVNLDIKGRIPSSGSLTITSDGSISGQVKYYNNEYIFYVCNSEIATEEFTNCSIEKVTYLPKNAYELGSEIDYAGLLWLVVSDEEDNITLSLKNTIGEASFGSKFDYNASEVKNLLEEFFNGNEVLLQAKEQENLIKTVYDEVEEYIRIPLKEEVGFTKIKTKCDTAWCLNNTPYWLLEYDELLDEKDYILSVGENGIVYSTASSMTLNVIPVITVVKK